MYIYVLTVALLPFVNSIPMPYPKTVAPDTPVVRKRDISPFPDYYQPGTSPYDIQTTQYDTNGFLDPSTTGLKHFAASDNTATSDNLIITDMYDDYSIV
jgi:hypothetical protein